MNSFKDYQLEVARKGETPSFLEAVLNLGITTGKVQKGIQSIYSTREFETLSIHDISSNTQRDLEIDLSDMLKSITNLCTSLNVELKTLAELSLKEVDEI